MLRLLRFCPKLPSRRRKHHLAKVAKVGGWMRPQQSRLLHITGHPEFPTCGLSLSQPSQSPGLQFGSSWTSQPSLGYERASKEGTCWREHAGTECIPLPTLLRPTRQPTCLMQHVCVPVLRKPLHLSLAADNPPAPSQHSHAALHAGCQPGTEVTPHPGIHKGSRTASRSDTDT